MLDGLILDNRMREEVRQKSTVDYVLHFDSLPSTNDRAKVDCAQHIPCGMGLYTAAEQSAGRGRGQNVWEAGPGALLFSLVWSLDHFPLPESEWPKFSLGCGLAVCQALEQVDPQAALSVKWPNDVYLDGKKIAGLLLEPSANKRALILGVGCNVHNDLSSLSSDVQIRAARLQDYMPDPNRNRMGDVLLAMIKALETAMLRAMGGSSGVVELWSERCFLTGKPIAVCLGEQRIEGLCRGLASDGALQIETCDGIQRCYAGSVEIL